MGPPLPSLVSSTASPQGQGIYLFTLTAIYLFTLTAVALSFLNWGFVNLFDKLVQWRWFHCICWCVFIKGHSHNLCDAASRAMDRALQNVDYYYGLTDMSSLTIQHVVRCAEQAAGRQETETPETH